MSIAGMTTRQTIEWERQSVGARVGPSLCCEILPIALQAGQIMYIRRSRDAAAAWYEPHTAAHPSDTVRARLEAFFGPILDPGASVVHSTAWRYEYGAAGGRLILTYLAVLPPLCRVSFPYTAGQITLEPVGVERPARGGTLAPPDQSRCPRCLPTHSITSRCCWRPMSPSPVRLGRSGARPSNNTSRARRVSYGWSSHRPMSWRLWGPVHKLVIFDKDGTLIDFHAMWGGWITGLARRLEAAAGIAVAGGCSGGRLRPGHRTVAPSGPLAVAVDGRAARPDGRGAARGRSARRDSRAAATEAAWYIPDPVALARPLADLPALFRALRERGLRIAVATTDDRAPTLATLEALGIAPLVDALACGDDGRAHQAGARRDPVALPELGIAPAQAVMVGDTAGRPADGPRGGRGADDRRAVGGRHGRGAGAVCRRAAAVGRGAVTHESRID